MKTAIPLCGGDPPERVKKSVKMKFMSLKIVVSFIGNEANLYS